MTYVIVTLITLGAVLLIAWPIRARLKRLRFGIFELETWSPSSDD